MFFLKSLMLLPVPQFPHLDRREEKETKGANMC